MGIRFNGVCLAVALTLAPMGLGGSALRAQPAMEVNDAELMRFIGDNVAAVRKPAATLSEKAAKLDRLTSVCQDAAVAQRLLELQVELVEAERLAELARGKLEILDYWLTYSVAIDKAYGPSIRQAHARAMGELEAIRRQAERLQVQIKAQIVYYNRLPLCGRYDPDGTVRAPPGPPPVWPGPIDGPAKPLPAPPLPPCRNKSAEDDIAATKASINALRQTLQDELAEHARDAARLKEASNGVRRSDKVVAAMTDLIAKNRQRMANTGAALTAAEDRLSALERLKPCATAALGQACAPPRPLSDFEKGLLKAMNDIRRDPPSYAGFLRQTLGVPLGEATAFLRSQPPVPALAFHPALMRSAERHVGDIGPTGSISHTGSDGSGPLARVQREGLFVMTAAEEISVGQTTAIGALNILIIDPSSPTRAHRTDLFDPKLVLAGVACGPHARFGTACVIDLSGPPLVRDNAPADPCYPPPAPPPPP